MGGGGFTRWRGGGVHIGGALRTRLSAGGGAPGPRLAAAWRAPSAQFSGGGAPGRGSAVAAATAITAIIVVAAASFPARGRCVIGGAIASQGYYGGPAIIMAMLPLSLLRRSILDDSATVAAAPRAAMMRLIASRGSVPTIPNRERISAATATGTLARNRI